MVYTCTTLLYPFICQWTSRLLPCPSYCKQCCDEHWGTLRYSAVCFNECSGESQSQSENCWRSKKARWGCRGSHTQRPPHPWAPACLVPAALQPSPGGSGLQCLWSAACPSPCFLFIILPGLTPPLSLTHLIADISILHRTHTMVSSGANLIGWRWSSL